MSRRFPVHLPMEEAYLRKVSFAVEVLDALTLARVSEGLEVVAEGLQEKPVVNAGGLFVWRTKDLAGLEKIRIDPRSLPYQSVERERGELALPPPPAKPGLTTIELPPTVNYPFAGGVTGLRGALIEDRVVPPEDPVPVVAADLWLRWLDEDEVTWRHAATSVRSDSRGDFAAFLRLAPNQAPRIDAGTVTVRVRARRGAVERESPAFSLPQGRVADPSTFSPDPSALTFAWDEFQP